mgnify:CR=1 FL=1
MTPKASIAHVIIITIIIGRTNIIIVINTVIIHILLNSLCQYVVELLVHPRKRHDAHVAACLRVVTFDVKRYG